jgi:triosephosphate isomerase
MTGGPIRPLVAGNWKMNGLAAELAEAEALAEALRRTPVAADVMLCPPATLLAPMAAAVKGSAVLLGGQDCHTAPSGAHTGDIAAPMLADAGARAVIVGHSERRAAHGELDRTVRAKAEAAHAAGLTAIICVGETAGERQADLTETVVRRQLAGSLPDAARAASTVIAYEPVWAIGSGLTPTAEDVARVHAAIRQALTDRYGEEGAGMRILYGGSVKPANARELLAVKHVNGALVGGASLKAADFLGIIAAYGG